MLKNLSKQSDYDNRYQLLNGKVIQKTLTTHIFFNKIVFSFRIAGPLLWNSLDSNIKSSFSVCSFRNRMNKKAGYCQQNVRQR